MLQQLDDEAEGRGGRGGKALAELEDTLRADIHRQQDELNAALKAASRRELRGAAHRRAPTELVEAAAGRRGGDDRARLARPRRPPILFGDEVIVSAGRQGGQGRRWPAQEGGRATRSSASTRRSRSRRPPRRRASRSRSTTSSCQMDAALEAERERLQGEAEGLKEEIRTRQGRDPRSSRPGHAPRDIARRLELPRPRPQVRLRRPRRAAHSSAPAWAPRPSVS